MSLQKCQVQTVLTPTFETIQRAVCVNKRLWETFCDGLLLNVNVVLAFSLYGKILFPFKILISKLKTCQQLSHPLEEFSSGRPPYNHSHLHQFTPKLICRILKMKAQGDNCKIQKKDPVMRKRSGTPHTTRCQIETSESKFKKIHKHMFKCIFHISVSVHLNTTSQVFYPSESEYLLTISYLSWNILIMSTITKLVKEKHTLYLCILFLWFFIEQIFWTVRSLIQISRTGDVLTDPLSSWQTPNSGAIKHNSDRCRNESSHILILFINLNN